MKENNLSIRRSQLVSKNLSQISKKLNLHKSIIIEKILISQIGYIAIYLNL